MKFTTKCLCCQKEYELDTIKDKVWKYDYCSEKCKKIYYNIYFLGFVPHNAPRPLKIPDDTKLINQLAKKLKKKGVIVRC